MTKRAAAMLPMLAAATLLGGCLDEPGIEDRWTRLDLVSASVSPGQMMPPGTSPVTLKTAVTYRSILTGFAVAELRSSPLAAGMVELDPEADRGRMATDIDALLANSVTLGRATRAVTGWDHLIQRIDFAFSANVPAPDSANSGLFLVCYLGSGTEIELADGSDSLVVTPFPSAAYEVLPVGLELGMP